MSTSKTILVTGGAGFIGSHLCERLAREGHRVISLDNYFTGSRENHVPGVEYRQGHTKDVARHVPEEIDLIYHLGEYSRVEQSVFEPDIVHDLNVLGTAGIIEFWRERKCKLVYAGSSTKFGDAGATRHTSPYAATKAANSELVKRVGDSEQLPYAITYFYNVYGPRERAGVYGTVIESFKQMHKRGAPLTVVAPGTQQRNFTHIDDLIDGLILVGEQGEGDEFGLGNAEAVALIDVARYFGGEVIMLPEREGNRMQAGLDTTKTNALGWEASRSVSAYIKEFLEGLPATPQREKRVLVFSTTFHPVSGPAEDALIEVAKALPNVAFDVVTTCFTKAAKKAASPAANIYVHRVGWGSDTDKYLLPLLGFLKARELTRAHDYLFAWSLMASYAALAGIAFKKSSDMPLLITLADQDLTELSALKKQFIRMALSDADQVYGSDTKQEGQAATISKRTSLRRSIGDGDAFANPIRFIYSDSLRKGV